MSGFQPACVGKSAQCQEVAQTSGRGDQSIVSYGDVIYEEPCYDHVTQIIEEDMCLESYEEPIDQGYYDDIMEQQEFTHTDVTGEEELISDVSVEADDIMEQQEFTDTDVSGEEELISDVSVEASLGWDSEGNIFY